MAPRLLQALQDGPVPPEEMTPALRELQLRLMQPKDDLVLPSSRFSPVPPEGMPQPPQPGPEGWHNRSLLDLLRPVGDAISSYMTPKPPPGFMPPRNPLDRGFPDEGPPAQPSPEGPALRGLRESLESAPATMPEPEPDRPQVKAKPDGEKTRRLYRDHVADQQRRQAEAAKERERSLGEMRTRLEGVRSISEGLGNIPAYVPADFMLNTGYRGPQHIAEDTRTRIGETEDLQRGQQMLSMLRQAGLDLGTGAVPASVLQQVLPSLAQYRLAQAAGEAEAGKERRDVLSDSVKAFNAEAKDLRKSIDASNSLEAQLKSENPLGARLGVISLVKAAGESGRLSNQDIARAAKLMGYKGLIQSVTEFVSAEPDAEWLRLARGLVQTTRERATEALGELADRYVDQAGRIHGDIAGSPEEVRSVLLAGPEGEAVDAQAHIQTLPEGEAVEGERVFFDPETGDFHAVPEGGTAEPGWVEVPE